MKIIKRALFMFTIVIFLTVFALPVFAVCFVSEVTLPDSGSFVISFDSIRDQIGTDIYSISADPSNAIYLLKDVTKASEVYSVIGDLGTAEFDNSDIIYYLDTGGGYTTRLYIDLPVSDFVYEIDIYYETVPNTYALYRSNLTIYNFSEDDRSLSIDLLGGQGVKYKIVFKDAALKLDSETTVNIILYKQDDFIAPEIEPDPMDVYCKQLEDGLYEYLYDFLSMIFIDDIDIKDDIVKIYTSKDAQHFNTASVMDIGNGLYTRFLKIITADPIDTMPSFISYKRYIVLEGEKDQTIELRINSNDPYNPSDIICTEGSVLDYRLLNIPGFTETTETATADGPADLTFLIMIALVLFMIYPCYLLFRYLRLKLFK